jgi:hypothetical protein
VTEGSLRYDWRAEPESFLKWLLPTLIAGRENFDDLSEATNKFTDVILTMQVNGIEVPTEHFIKSLMMNYEKETRDAAREMLDNVVQITDIEDLINDLHAALKDTIRERCTSAGVELMWSEDDD